MISKEEFEYLRLAVKAQLDKGTPVEGFRIVEGEAVLKAMDEAYEALVPPAYRPVGGK